MNVSEIVYLPGRTQADVAAGDILLTENRPAAFLAKRIFDVALSSLLLVLFAPLMAVIALAIALESRGGAIFAHERVGVSRRVRRGHAYWEPRVFRVFKFRTMVAGADQTVHMAHVAACANGELANRPSCKLQADPRVTRVGRLLRSASLDELPQLLNVLRGEMSLVGPRPLPPYEVARHEPEDRRRLAALPGITGLWQVTGRCALDYDQMLRLDSEYVENQTFLRDLKLLAMTLPAVVTRRGAG